MGDAAGRHFTDLMTPRTRYFAFMIFFAFVIFWLWDPGAPPGERIIHGSNPPYQALKDAEARIMCGFVAKMGETPLYYVYRSALPTSTPEAPQSRLIVTYAPERPNAFANPHPVTFSNLSVPPHSDLHKSGWFVQSFTDAEALKKSPLYGWLQTDNLPQQLTRLYDAQRCAGDTK